LVIIVCGNQLEPVEHDGSRTPWIEALRHYYVIGAMQLPVFLSINKSAHLVCLSRPAYFDFDHFRQCDIKTNLL